MFIIYVILTRISFPQSPGTLDNTFGTGGKIIQPIGSGNEVANDVAFQKDGKIIVAGYTRVGSNDDVAVLRYNSNGILDITFGTNGRMVFPIGTSTDFCYTVLVQSDGKIVVGGGAAITSFGFEWFLARLDTNGILDNSFGTGGIVITQGNTQPEYIYSIVEQASGKIIAVGVRHDGVKGNFTVMRYNVNGTLDNTFGVAGIATTSFGDFSSSIRSVKVLQNGNILVAGSASNGVNTDFAAAMYDSNGVPINNFGDAGKVLTPIGTGNDIAYSVDEQYDGKYILGGASRVGTMDNYALVRYNSNGSLDNTFSGDGKLVSGIGSDTSVCYSLNYIKNFGILAAGRAKNGTDVDFSLVLYDSTGSFVNTFGSSGVVFTDFNDYDWAYGSALQKDGKIVLVGYAAVGSATDWAIARYYGSPQTSIDTENVNDLQSFSLLQNYPNPFNHVTQIQFSLPESGNAVLKIFDSLGREINTLFSGFAEARIFHRLAFDAQALVSGVYLAQLRFKDQVQNQKMLLIK